MTNILLTFQTTLCGFESYLPFYFEGATKAYEVMKSEQNQRQNRATYRKPVSAEVEAHLRTSLVMRRDLDFYHWAVQRFYRQIKQLGDKCKMQNLNK